MATYFDEIYVASTLKELEYRGVKIERGLTENELHAVETAVGAPLPPDLALLLRGGLLSGEGFPDWRNDPQADMQRARDWVTRAFIHDIEGGQWWFDEWGPRPRKVKDAIHTALAHLSVAPPLVPVYSHRFMPAEPARYGNPILSVYQAVDSIYYGYDLAHYLHTEFGVPRPLWSADVPPRVPFWGTSSGCSMNRGPAHRTSGEVNSPMTQERGTLLLRSSVPIHPRPSARHLVFNRRALRLMRRVPDRLQTMESGRLLRCIPGRSIPGFRSPTASMFSASPNWKRTSRTY